MNPSISIVVPVFNVEKYLNQCVSSLLEQTLSSIEIILVDDGSCDNSPKMCDEFEKTDSRIRVIHKSNGGLSSARNAGMEYASGEYIMFLDSDDWIEPQTCETLYASAKENDSEVVVCSYVKEFIGHSVVSHIWDFSFTCDSQKIIRRLYGPINEELHNPQDLDLPVSACMQIILAKVAKEVLFVDTKKIGTEDLLYQIMVYSKVKKYSYVKESFYHYRRSDYGTLTTSYMPTKFERWQNLYDILYSQAEKDTTNCDLYKTALGNRIAFSTISLGLNEILSDQSFYKKASRLKEILGTERYIHSIGTLELKWLPIHWKFFFFLCRHKLSMTLTALLVLIEFLRTHKH